jgi:predicted aspartyl protease
LSCRAGAGAISLLCIFFALSHSARSEDRSVWQGSYSCLQGETGVTLTMTVTGEHSLDAVFEFRPTPRNPSVPAGSFMLQGDPAAPDGLLNLRPFRWISRPPGYGMVGLQGSISGDSYQGRITGGYRCDVFSLKRVEGRQAGVMPSSGAGPIRGAGDGQIRVPVQLSGGTFSVPVTISGAITIPFVIDSGAADVSIPADVVATLVRTGTLTSGDFTGTETYILADGSKLPSVTFTLRALQIGDKLVTGIKGSLSPMSGEPLLGQSFLGRLRSWSIENGSRQLVLD